MPKTEPIRDINKLRQLAGYYLQRGQIRNYAMIVLGVHTALRISDLLQLRWTDVYDVRRGDFHTHITVTERKTRKHRLIALNQKAISALRMLLPDKRGDYIFVSNRKSPLPISRVQAWRIIKKAVDAIMPAGCYACHSLRKVLGYFAWKNGVHPALIMDIYGHCSFEITRRYLGIQQDDRDNVYLSMSLF